ncbi:MAG: TIGR03936 family radical SAM-associated protein, partial [candidate division WOR-3 bacterium]
PLIIGGGPAALNPLPLAPFFDLFVIGDGEEVLLELIDIYRHWDRKSKIKLLESLSEIDGIWVPLIHKKDKFINKRTVKELKEEDAPYPPLLPICPIVHDRLVVEIMRGCTWGCRFCQAGYVNRPCRMRDPEQILRIVDKSIRATGWEEVSLLAYSALDYNDLPYLLSRLNENLNTRKVGISLPSIRGELFNWQIAEKLAVIKKSGLTFAPETASDSLRRRINKHFTNSELIQSLVTAYDYGWRTVKMYFMIGLPYETENDVKEIPHLLNEIVRTIKKGVIKASISPFIPKPHTPFQNESFLSIEELKEKIRLICRNISSTRVKLNFRDVDSALIEAVLSRGDERLARVIEYVYRQGGRFEEWSEGFELKRWTDAFDKLSINIEDYLSGPFDNRWHFINTGVKASFLSREWERAQKSEPTKNCRYNGCNGCGACQGMISPKEEQRCEISNIPVYSHCPQPISAVPVSYRIKYTVGEDFRYASHLDLMRTFYRALRRSDLPVMYSRGFSPIPRISFGPAKSVGMVSQAEYLDIQLNRIYTGNLGLEINRVLPRDVRVVDFRILPNSSPPLNSIINLVTYEIPVKDNFNPVAIDNFINQEDIYLIKDRKNKNIRINLRRDVYTIQRQNSSILISIYLGEKRARIYDVIGCLFNLNETDARAVMITRTGMFILRGDGYGMSSPMEVR